MKRIRKWVIGGIQSKIVALILFTLLMLFAANLAIHQYQSHMLSQLAEESGRRQQEAIGEISDAVMNSVVTQTLERSNRTEARNADAMFSAVRNQVRFMADYATRLLAHPGDYELRPCASPDPADDGAWTAKVICADGVDPDDPQIVARVGLLSNLSDVMITLCPSFGAADAYIALPEGVHLSVSDNSSSWFVDGQLRSYDPRGRGWYRQAAEAGELIFTDGEWDATTGAYCIECACPVYGPDGSLAAVVGADLFLDEMQAVMQAPVIEGEYLLLVNQSGRAVLQPQEEAFPMAEEDRGADLRAAQTGLLAQVVRDAVQGSGTGVVEGPLADGDYYVTASVIETTGWVLISAYSRETAGQPALLLQSRNAEIQSETTAEYRAKMRKSRMTASVLLIVVLLLTLGNVVVLGRNIVKPLNTITRRIADLREGDLEFRMEDAYRTGDEVEALAESFASLSHKTSEYLETVKRVTAEKERIGAELELATQIQAAMLPHIFPPFPDRTDFDVYGSMDPAKEVGGDFFDYFLIDDDHLCMVIADVSGKGVPAALFMMASKIILQSVAMLGKTPAEILTRTNEAICSNNEAQMFVTVWLGILELSTGRLTAANAGHEYPVLKRPGGPYEVYRDRHGFVIGGMEDVEYREYVLQLEPGSKLFVYTDGVPEATGAEGEPFGAGRMLKALNDRPDAAPQETLKNVRAAVDGFVQDAEQFDDLTMLCMEYKGPQKDAGNAG